MTETEAGTDIPVSSQTAPHHAAAYPETFIKSLEGITPEEAATLSKILLSPYDVGVAEDQIDEGDHGVAPGTNNPENITV